MKNQHKIFQYTALLLSITCLLAFAGCQRQFTQPNAPTGENSDISSVVVSSFPSSQAPESEAAPSTEESPASSQEAPSPSSQTEQPASQPVTSESSQSETPTIPFSRGLPTEHECDSKSITTSFDAKIIQNTQEAQKYKDDLREESRYTEEFFEKYALILLFTDHIYSHYYDEINFISKSNHQLIVDYTVVQYYGSTPNGIKRIIPLQVKKSDMESITEIVPQPHEMKLKKDEVRVQTDDPLEFVD